ncbi:MAG: O-antigen ligase family protein [Coriobacteriia bacterium]|nr:O-antigen ligase family protein [Coriobacteriia bacterium]MBN2823371.1 O-antigen ligase family protein [Coriobacteriia bacterium]
MIRSSTQTAPWMRVAAWAVVALLAGVAAGLLEGALGLRALYLVVLVPVSVASAVLVLRSPEHGLLFMLAALPLDTFGRIITRPTSVTVFHVVLLLTLFSWGRLLLKGDRRIERALSPVGVGVLLLVFAALWSLPGSLAPATTAVSVLRIMFLGLFYAAFAVLIRDERVARRVILALVLTAVASSVLAIAQYSIPGLGIGNVHTQFTSGGGSVIRPEALFDDPNYLATFLSVGVIAALGMAVHAKRLRGSALWVGAAGLSAVGLVMTFSRTGWVGVIAGAGVLILSAAPARRRVFMAVVGVLVVAVVLISPEMITSRFSSITDVNSDASVRTRYLMIGSTQDMIADNWVFGTGLGAFDQAYPRYRQPGALIPITKPHQLPLAMWAEMGIPALVAEVVIVCALAAMLWRRRRVRWGVYQAIGVAALVAVLVQSLFQYYLYFEYLWLSLALSVAAARFEQSRKEVTAS